MQHYKINYVYLLDLSPENKVNPYGVFETALGLVALRIFLFLMSKLSLKFGLFDGEYTLYSLLINLLFIIYAISYSILSFQKRNNKSNEELYVSSWERCCKI